MGFLEVLQEAQHAALGPLFFVIRLVVVFRFDVSEFGVLPSADCRMPEFESRVRRARDRLQGAQEVLETPLARGINGVKAPLLQKVSRCSRSCRVVCWSSPHRCLSAALAPPLLGNCPQTGFRAGKERGWTESPCGREGGESERVREPPDRSPSGDHTRSKQASKQNSETARMCVAGRGRGRGFHKSWHRRADGLHIRRKIH